MLIPPKLKYRTSSPKGHKSTSANNTRKPRSMAWYLNESAKDRSKSKRSKSAKAKA